MNKEIDFREKSSGFIPIAGHLWKYQATSPHAISVCLAMMGTCGVERGIAGYTLKQKGSNNKQVHCCWFIKNLYTCVTCVSHST